MEHREFEKLINSMRLYLAFLYQPEALEHLLEKFGDPENIFRHSPEELEALSGIPKTAKASLGNRRFLESARRELERAGKEGVHVLLRGSPAWPANFSGLPGMPLLLFSRGRILPADSRAVGIVGSRRPSRYGLQQAERFAAELAALGVTVVSGLARGIDAAAHLGALEAGGRTIAVLGSGLGRIYPREHLDLARRISGAGALLTEFPWETPPRQFHFPHRNRILSAVSLGVLVVEGGERSGSLITAQWALEQGREVFALPGRIDSSETRGSLRLIQDGARLVVEPEEIVEILGILVPSGGPRKNSGQSQRGGPALRPLPVYLAPLFEEEDAWHADRIIHRLGRPPGEVLAELSRLESEGLLQRLPGGAYTLR